MADQLTPFLKAFVELLGFKDPKNIYWEAIVGTPHTVRRLRIKTFTMLFYCLKTFNYHIIHFEDPRVELRDENPFKVKIVDIAIIKTNRGFKIDRIYTEEEEYDLTTDFKLRMKKMLEIVKLGLDLFFLITKFLPSSQ